MFKLIDVIVTSRTVVKKVSVVLDPMPETPLKRLTPLLSILIARSISLQYICIAVVTTMEISAAPDCEKKRVTTRINLSYT